MKDQYQHYLELLKGLRLMDDDFFSEALDEKIEPVEYILRTILTHWWTPMSSSSLSMTNMVQACRYIM